LDTIVTNINAASAGVTASVIPDGSGERLRISSDSSVDFTITQAAADTFLSNVSMRSADVRVSTQIHVRSDIISTPSLTTTGSVQWNEDLGVSGEYFMSEGDNTIIDAMTSMFTSLNSFDAAGGLSSTSATFVTRATSVVSYNSTKVELNASQATYQEDLSNSLKTKSDNFRGVNLDEEMSNLMLFEQAYSASARVISAVQSMFDALENIIR